VEIEGSEPYVVGGHTASGYWIGADRSTTLPGLFAAGDVAGGCPQKYVTGAFVEGEIAAESAARFAAKAATKMDLDSIKNTISKQIQHFSGTAADSPYTTESLEEAMQQAMDEYAGGIKSHYGYSESSLKIAVKHIERLQSLSDSLRAEDAYGLLKIFELRERLLVCQTLLAHLAARKETRWPGFAEHLDYPKMRDEFKVFINSRLEEGQIKIIRRPLNVAAKEAVG
jgi:adenylylsulfate reductase subunit A